MILKLNWKTLCLSLFVIFAAGYIGFWLGQPQYCCSYSGNKDWIDVTAAISGPLAGLAAIGIAIWNNRNTNQRFFRQLRAELRLDKKADARQQAEWKERASEAKKERNVLRKSIRIGMIAELKVSQELAKKNIEALQNLDSSVWKEKRVEEFYPFRPVYENMSNNAVLLNNSIIGIITVFEPRYKIYIRKIQGRIGKFNRINRHENKVEAGLFLETEFTHYIAFTTAFIEQLKKV